jgi:hypothetical protein
MRGRGSHVRVGVRDHVGVCCYAVSGMRSWVGLEIPPGFVSPDLENEQRLTQQSLSTHWVPTAPLPFFPLFLAFATFLLFFFFFQVAFQDCLDPRPFCYRRDNRRTGHRRR